MSAPPTREEVEAAMGRIERDISTFGKIRQDAGIVARAFRALIASQPRVWTAETIKDASEGMYFEGVLVGTHEDGGILWDLKPANKKDIWEMTPLSRAYGPFILPHNDTLTTNKEKT